jgi:hypothetical protein
MRWASPNIASQMRATRTEIGSRYGAGISLESIVTMRFVSLKNA